MRENIWIMHWIEICRVDRVINLLNNWGSFSKQELHRTDLTYALHSLSLTPHLHDLGWWRNRVYLLFGSSCPHFPTPGDNCGGKAMKELQYKCDRDDSCFIPSETMLWNNAFLGVQFSCHRSQSVFILVKLWPVLWGRRNLVTVYLETLLISPAVQRQPGCEER